MIARDDSRICRQALRSSGRADRVQGLDRHPGVLSRRRGAPHPRRHESGRPGVQGACRRLARERGVRRPAAGDPLRVPRRRCRPCGAPRAARCHQHARVRATHDARSGCASACSAAWRRMGGAGYALDISDGRLRLTVGDGSRTAQVESDVTLCAQCWYSLGATYDPATGEATIYQAPVRNSYNSLLSPMVALPAPTIVRGSAAVAPADADVAFTIAADAVRGSAISTASSTARRCGAARSAMASSKPSATAQRLQAPGWSPTGTSPRASARAACRPTTCATSRARPLRHLRQPAGARDDGLELGLQRGVLPARARAVRCHPLPRRRSRRLRLGDGRRAHDPGRHAQRRLCAARPPGRGRGPHSVLRDPAARHRDRPDIAFLVPTASYLAYANDHIVHDVPVAQSILGHTSVLSEQDFYLYGNLDLGLSTYDSHSDGSGVLLLVVAPADHEHAAQVPPRHGLGVAVPGRPAPRRLAGREGLRVRRRHRPRAALRGPRDCSTATGSCSPDRTPSTTRSACSTPGRSTWRTAGARCTSARTASTG